MSRQLTRNTSVDNLRKEAKRWLRALSDGDAAARDRLRRAWPDAAAEPGLRDVQHALAREFGLPGWRALKEAVAAAAAGGSERDRALRALLDAASHGDAARVAGILDAHPDLVNVRGTLEGHTGMRTALHFGIAHEPVVRILLDRGADPNIRDDGDNAFPLHFAAERGDAAIIHLLVEHGADTNGEGDGHELAVIGWATCFGKADPAIVSYLLEHGAHHNIFSAVVVGDEGAMRSIARRSPEQIDKPMDRTNLHRRPLHLAVTKKRRESLRALLELGADPNGVDGTGLTALDEAALAGETEMARTLLQRGASLTLPAAIALERTADIERLIAEDPQALQPGHRWGTLIVRAAATAPRSVIATLIRLGASVNVTEDPAAAIDRARGYTALHAAAFHGNLDTAAALLEHGADPRIRDDKYCGTPAGWASYARKPELVKLITDGPIDLFDAIDFDRPDRIPEILRRDPAALARPFGAYGRCSSRPGQWWPEAGTTPLAWATSEGKLEAAKTLASRGAEFPSAAHLASAHADRVASFLRMTCLNFTVYGSDRDRQTHAATRLLKQYPDIARDSLYTAVACGEIDEVRRILARQPAAALEPGGPRGWPPILYLCSARLSEAGPWIDNSVAIAQALVDAGADPNAFAEGGSADVHYTALAYVAGRGEEQAPVHPEARALSALLLTRGAEPYDAQVLYNVFAGHASHPLLADDDFTWLLELIYQESIRRGRQADWADPVWPMLGMGGYGGGAWYLLHNALKGNYLGIAEWALSHGASPDPPRASDPRTPVGSLYELARQRGLTAFAELLARYGAPRVEPPADLGGQFARACFDLDRGLAERLVTEHPELLQDPAAMFAAAESDRADVVELLLDLGMSPDIENDRFGHARPLHPAAYAGSAAVAALLIERGAQIDPRDRQHGTTPLYWAYFGRRQRLVNLLAPFSRDVWALVPTAKVERLREVLLAEPRLARSVSEGDTPLFYLPDDEAAAAEIARMFVAASADPAVQRPDGTTAGQLARARGLVEAADILTRPIKEEKN